MGLELGIIFLILAVINGCFVCSEWAFRHLRPGRLEEQAEEGDEDSEYLLASQSQWELYIRTAQYGEIFCLLLAGWLGMVPLAMWLNFLMVGYVWDHWAWIPSVIGVGLVWMISSQIAQGIAIVRAEKSALLFLLPLRWLSKLFFPLTAFSHWICQKSLRFLNLAPLSEEESAHSEEELRQIVSASQRGGVIDQVEGELIDNVLDFSDRVVREIMIPRQDMEVLYLEDSWEDQIATIREGRHTRYPLCTDDKDHVLGMVHIRDLTEWALNQSGKPLNFAEIQREVLVVPEGMFVSELLQMMRLRRIHMAVVADEYGGTAGLVSMEDILEELVGEINDEYDEDEIEEMKSLPDGGYDLDGKALFEDVAELLSLNIEDPEEETIGGYVFRLLGQKPMVGDQVKVGKWDVTVTETQGFRVVRLQVLPTDEPEVLLETEE